MIAVDGQFFLTVSIEGKEDFLVEEDLILFKLQEETGNVLPRFELEFLTSDEKLIAQLNEGNTISVVLGRSQDDSDRIESQIQIVIPTENKESSEKRRVHLLGVYKNLAYTNNPSTEITDKMSGMEVVQKYASQNWEADIQPATSDDEPMPWMKQFTTNKKMVDKALSHLLLASGVPICGITSKGVFIVRNIEDLKSEEPVWNFTREPQKANDMFFDGDPKTINEGTFNNTTNNYGRAVRVFDTIQGTSKLIEYKGKPQLSQTGSLPRSKDILMIPGTNEFRTDTVHPDYELAALKNSTELTSLSSVRTAITIPRVFFPIKVVDPVTLADKGIGASASLTNTFTSGTRIVTKVCRIIANRQFSTYVEMVVESINAPEGSFLDLGGIDAIADSLCSRAFSFVSPANNAISGICDKLCKTLTAPLTGLKDQVTSAISAIPKPDGATITHSIISGIVGDSVFDTHMSQVKGVVGKIGSLGNSLSKTASDASSNLCGSSSSMVRGMGRYTETPLQAQRTPGISEKEVGYNPGNHTENAIDMYNQPPAIGDISQDTIRDTFQDVADTYDLIGDNTKNTITKNTENGINDVINDSKDRVTDDITQNVVDQIKKADPVIADPTTGGDYVNSVTDAVTDTVRDFVDDLYNNDRVIRDVLDSNVKDITDTLDDIIQDCTNSLNQGADAGSDLSKLFPTDTKPGVMTPNTTLDVWRCDGI